MSPLIASTIPSELSFTPHVVTSFAHELDKEPCFADAGLVDLFDSYPRASIEIMTMGSRLEDAVWRRGDPGDLSGSEILRAIAHGHLWVNIKHVHREHRVIAALVERLYDEVAAGTGEALPSWKASTLLVSSPTAFVEYHADAVPNFLWHIRGRKRVWIYPAHEERYCPAAILEDICTGHKPEGLPYDESLDAGAVCVDLEPGQVVSWPLNAPHRVQNLEGLNVSLSTEHVTKATRKSLRVVRGNRVLRRALGRRPTLERSGLAAGFKAGIGTIEHVFTKLTRRRATAFEWPMTFRVDPDAALGYVDDARSQSVVSSGAGRA